MSNKCNHGMNTIITTKSKQINAYTNFHIHTFSNNPAIYDLIKNNNKFHYGGHTMRMSN